MRSRLTIAASVLALLAPALAYAAGPPAKTGAGPSEGSRLVRPSSSIGEVESATYAAIANVIQGVLQELNGTGDNLGAFYLADPEAVFFGPPAAGPELTRTVIINGQPQEVIQTGVIPGDQVSGTLSACLLAFAQRGTPVTVIANNDLDIRVAGPFAVATLTGINVVEATQNAVPWRWTLVLERVSIGGTERWMIVHDHLSFS